MNKKLILFDIDGTLMWHVGDGVPNWIRRFRISAKEVFGVDPGEFSARPLFGKVERDLVWTVLKPFGVTRKVFLEKQKIFSDHMFDQLLADPVDQALYQQIPEAKKLVELLSLRPDVRLGVITGNMERISAWKLDHAGYSGQFPFGVYADEADDRFALAKTVYPKANAFFHESFGPDNTVVIGDTSRDVECARHIGAKVIAVTTGGHDRKTLEDAKPDLLVDSLMDPAVLAFFN